MQIYYASNRLKKQFSNASEIKKTFGVNAKRVAARLADIESAPNLAMFMQLPAANCHALSGDRKGEWAVTISANYRLIFEIAHDPLPLKENDSVDTIRVTDIRITGTTDYH